MSLWGKIFIFLNVVAAVLFAFVAVLDYDQRQRWAYEVYRHDLLVEGLPIDATERDPDGTLRVDKLSPKTLSAIEPSSTGTPSKTQEEEVRRVRALVEAKINGGDVPGTKGQKMARYLRALARTGRERDQLTLKINGENDPQKVPADELLQQRWEREFAGVNEAGPDGKHSIQQRKDNAARLLFCLGEALHEAPAEANADYFASPEYKRFVNVVGLTGAAHAAEDQSLVVQKMTDEAIAGYDADLRTFMNSLDMAAYKAQGMSDNVERQDKFLKEKEKQIANAKLLVQARTEQLNALKEELATLQGKTSKALVDQAKVEEEVMKGLIDLRDTGKKNQELEREIRRLEGVK